MKMQQLHMDEIDAAIAGDKWLMDVARAHGATKIDNLTGDKNGCIRTAWKGNQLLAYFVVVRDDANWSVLVCHDFMHTMQSCPQPKHLWITPPNRHMKRYVKFKFRSTCKNYPQLGALYGNTPQ